jgi:hypothetical protein
VDIPLKQKRVFVVRVAFTPSFSRFWLLPRIRDLKGILLTSALSGSPI